MQSIIYYRPRSEASEGYVFTGVCHSVTNRGGGVTPNASWDRSHGQGGGGSAQHLPPPGQHLPPRTRSQHLPPPREHLPPPGQHLPPSPPGPGHNTSLPLPWHRSQHLPPPLDQVTTLPSPPPPPPGTGHNTALTLPRHRSQHLPPPWTRSQHPPPPAGLYAGGRYASYWNAFLLGYNIICTEIYCYTYRLYLLQGELFCCTNNPTEACQPFLSALTLAKQHNLLLMTAMATVHLAYVQVNLCEKLNSGKL